MHDAVQPALVPFAFLFSSRAVVRSSVNCGRAPRQLGKLNRRRDWESTSRADDAPGEEGEALRRGREGDPAATEYEVLLSFRGADTRDGFTDCPYRRLRLAGVHVILDNEELRVGKEIGGELSKALDKSRIYIPIFSRSYATSSWCLCEVAHMVEGISRSDGKKEILPIFYDVDPDDVKLKTKLYKEAIPKHDQKFGSVESDDVRFLGIHGVGGIGKTVFAKVVFNKLSSHFDGISFLNDVRESSQHGLINLPKKLISSFVGSMAADQIKDIGDGMNWIKRVCNTKKVLIVLDNLDKKKQLEKLAGKSD